MKRIAFLSFGFRRRNLRKQPWNYIYKVCNGLINFGNTVYVISDGNKKSLPKQKIGNLFIHNVGKITPWNYKKIVKILNNEKTDLVIWSFAPKSIFFYLLLKSLGRPIILFISIPLYNLLEILTAQKVLGGYNLGLYYKNTLVPKFFIRYVINSKFVRGIITLTENNKNRLVEIGCNKKKVWLIPHGKNRKSNKNFVFNKFDWNFFKTQKKQRVLETTRSFLYMGGPEKIRGLSWLIKASANALLKNPNLHFTILLRTDNEFLASLIKSECERYKLVKNVTIINGILPPQKVLDKIIECDFLVLPFILVPSEVPISILEAMNAGKPIIGTSVDGIPELIKKRGIIVKPGDSDALKKAILKLAFNDRYRNNLGERCKEYMKRYPLWEDSFMKLEKQLEDI